MRHLNLSLALLAAGLLAGCGDPAPSTPVAPEQKLPDISKMSKEEQDEIFKKSRDGGRD